MSWIWNGRFWRSSVDLGFLKGNGSVKLSSFQTWPEGDVLGSLWKQFLESTEPESFRILDAFFGTFLKGCRESMQSLEYPITLADLSKIETHGIRISTRIFAVMSEQLERINRGLEMVGEGLEEERERLIQRGNVLVLCLEIGLRNVRNHRCVMESGILIKLVEYQRLMTGSGKTKEKWMGMMGVLVVFLRVLTRNSLVGFYYRGQNRRQFHVSDIFGEEKTVQRFYAVQKDVLGLNDGMDVELCVMGIFAVFFSHRASRASFLDLGFCRDFRSILEKRLSSREKNLELAFERGIVLHLWEVVVMESDMFVGKRNLGREYVECLGGMSISLVKIQKGDFLVGLCRLVFENSFDRKSETLMDLWKEFVLGLSRLEDVSGQNMLVDVLAHQMENGSRGHVLCDLVREMGLMEGLIDQVHPRVCDLAVGLTFQTTNNGSRQYLGSVIIRYLKKTEVAMQKQVLMGLEKTYWKKISLCTMEVWFVKNLVRIVLDALTYDGSGMEELFRWIWRDMDPTRMQTVMDTKIGTRIFEIGSKTAWFSSWIAEMTVWVCGKYREEYLESRKHGALDLLYELVIRLCCCAKNDPRVFFGWVRVLERECSGSGRDVIRRVLLDLSTFAWLQDILCRNNLADVIRTMLVMDGAEVMNMDGIIDMVVEARDAELDRMFFEIVLRREGSGEMCSAFYGKMTASRKEMFLRSVRTIMETMERCGKMMVISMLLGGTSGCVLDEFLGTGGDHGLFQTMFWILNEVYSYSMTVNEFYRLLRSDVSVPGRKELIETCEKNTGFETCFVVNEGYIWIEIDGGYSLVSMWECVEKSHTVFQIVLKRCAIRVEATDRGYGLEICSGGKIVHARHVDVQRDDRFQLVSLYWRFQQRLYFMTDLEYVLYLDRKRVAFKSGIRMDAEQDLKEHVVIGGEGQGLPSVDEWNRLGGIMRNGWGWIPTRTLVGCLGSAYVLRVEDPDAVVEDLCNKKDVGEIGLCVHPRMESLAIEKVVLYGTRVFSSLRWSHLLCVSGGVSAALPRLLPGNHLDMDKFRFHLARLDRMLDDGLDGLWMDIELVWTVRHVVWKLGEHKLFGEWFDAMWEFLKRLYSFVAKHRPDIEVEYLDIVVLDPYLWRFDAVETSHFDGCFRILDALRDHCEKKERVWMFIECVRKNSGGGEFVLFGRCLDIVFHGLEQASWDGLMDLEKSGMDLMVYHLGTETDSYLIEKYLTRIVRWIGSFPDASEQPSGCGRRFPMAWKKISWERLFGWMFRQCGENKQCMSMIVELLIVVLNSVFVVDGQTAVLGLDPTRFLLGYCCSRDIFAETYPVLFDMVVTRKDDSGGRILVLDRVYVFWIEHVEDLADDELRSRMLTDLRNLVVWDGIVEENMAKLCGCPFWISGLWKMYMGRAMDTSGMYMYQSWKQTTDIMSMVGAWCLEAGFDFFVYFLVCSSGNVSSSLRLVQDSFRMLRQLGMECSEDGMFQAIDWIYHLVVYSSDMIELGKRGRRDGVWKENVDMDLLNEHFETVMVLGNMWMDRVDRDRGMVQDHQMGSLCLYVQLLLYVLTILDENTVEASIGLFRNICHVLDSNGKKDVLGWVLGRLEMVRKQKNSGQNRIVIELFVNELRQLWKSEVETSKVAKMVRKKHQMYIEHVVDIIKTLRLAEQKHRETNQANSAVSLENIEMFSSDPSRPPTSTEDTWTMFLEDIEGPCGHLARQDFHVRYMLDPHENRARMRTRLDRVCGYSGPMWERDVSISPQVYEMYMGQRRGGRKSGLEHKEQVFCERADLIIYLFGFSGTMTLSKEAMEFRMDCVDTKSVDRSVLGLAHDYCVPLEKITDVWTRKYLHESVSAEVRLADGLTLLFKFKNTRTRKLFVKKLGGFGVSTVESVREMLEKETRDWIEYRISNFEYLMRLNELAGRSYNDLSQYPVMPWILSDYQSESLDLADPGVYRDLSKPVGALNPERLIYFLNRYWDEDTSKFHYGTHYSSPSTVLYYLVRMEPFTFLQWNLQGNRNDIADRLFHSVESTWNNVLSCSTDVKELIPEFFCNSEFLYLSQHDKRFGHRQDGAEIGNVVLPPWCGDSPERFVAIHRQALESEHVSSNLHLWIDLIFGYKQRGKAAVQASNVFHYLTYEDSLDLCNAADVDEKKSMFMQMFYFGTTPTQLFEYPHPRRKRVAPPRYLSVWGSSGVAETKIRETAISEVRGPWTRLWIGDGGAGSRQRICLCDGKKTEIIDWENRVLGRAQLEGEWMWIDEKMGMRVCGWRKSIEFVDVDDRLRTKHRKLGEKLGAVHLGSEISAVAVSENGEYMAVGDSFGKVSLWRLGRDGTADPGFVDRSRFYGHEDAVGSVAVSHEYRFLATSSAGLVVVHSMFPMRCLFPVRAEHRVVDMAISARGNIVLVCEGNEIEVWTGNGRRICSMTWDRACRVRVLKSHPLVAIVDGRRWIWMHREWSLELVRRIEMSVNVVDMAPAGDDLACLCEGGRVVRVAWGE